MSQESPATTGTADHAPAPVISVKPVILPAPGRGVDLHVRISAPAHGTGLPVIVFAHGFGSSLDGYGPLTDYWAAHGFVVVQPTHLDSRTLGLAPDDPRASQIWRFRVEDMKRILENLERLEAAVPGLTGRVDHSRIAAAGHSFGGQTAGILLGLRVLPPAGSGEDMSDPRIKAGVLFATAGTGGDDLTPFAREHFPYLNPDFAHMTTPALVVAGDKDQSFLTVRGPDWSADPYLHSPGPKSLLTLFGAEHSLGGIPGYEAAETTDEDPARVALLQQLTTAYLRTALHPQDTSWPEAVANLLRGAARLGRIEESV
ncbi:Chlorophyllase [Frankia sp. AiPs1]|uniref:alpha/beta hydrolase family protein n=1 Tax=Frankia sp. AiPa1 TaxID=573492 RepID=UPI00202B74FF|nr:chlorophyllase [Frankia sp. AiPa1]MCL9758564.1 chlorophyllase [Frankia sp. AiPa1]